MCVGGGYLSRIQYTGAGSKALVLLPRLECTLLPETTWKATDPRGPNTKGGPVYFYLSLVLKSYHLYERNRNNGLNTWVRIFGRPLNLGAFS